MRNATVVMKKMNLNLPTCLSVVLFAIALHGVGSGQNLLVNPGFETGLTGWTQGTTGSTASTLPYQAATAGRLAAPMTGGTLNANYASDTGGNSVLEQVVNLTTVTPGQNLLVGGYFGGVGVDDSRLLIRFRNAALMIVGTVTIDYVTESMRNFEDLLMLRQQIVAIPPGATSLVCRIEFRTFFCCSPTDAAADDVFVIPTSSSVLPPAVPLNTEMIVNGNFESGWTPQSPLTPTLPNGWFGTAATGSLVQQYSTNPLNTSVPSSTVSCIVGGGAGSSWLNGLTGRLLTDPPGFGSSSLRQRIDVRGNTSQFAASSVDLTVSALLGCSGPTPTRIDVTLLSVSGAPLGGFSLGPVDDMILNTEPVVVRRSRTANVPATTAFIDLDIIFSDPNCCGAVGLVDNVSAILTTPTAPAPVTLNMQLVQNGSFESGSIAGSPLQLMNESCWIGATYNAPNYNPSRTLNYGSTAPTPVPSLNFATTSGLGGSLLASSFGVLRQTVDLTHPNDQARIAAGAYSVNCSAWLGGVGTNTRQAQVNIRFVNIIGVQVGGANGLRVLGPVTAAQRGNVTTLLQRSGTFVIPPMTQRMIIEVEFTNGGNCCTADGYADDIQATIFDNTITGSPVLYPGSNEDLRIATGINGMPTSGLGQEVKSAAAFDIVTVSVISPLGAFNLAPLVMLGLAAPTGAALPPVPGNLPAGLVWNPFAPSAFIIENGLGCVTFGCPVVLPVGTAFSYIIPPGLGGLSIYFQGVAIPLPSAPTIPANGLFASTEAHEIRL